MTIKTVGGSILEVGGQIADSEDCCCAPCSNGCGTSILGSYTLDFGVGGLTDGTDSDCDQVVGDIVVSQFADTCLWTFTFIGPMQIALLIVSDGSGNCFWRATATSTGIGFERATFESTPEPTATFDSSIMPVTLTKVSEAWAIRCTGSLPATITLDV